MKIISLFSGAGGLDLGFKQAGFDIVWANEFDPKIWETYIKNHKGTFLDNRSIKDIKLEEIPNADGIIGGPPCQSWSEAGAGRGINDERGKLFFDYISIIADKQPLFYLAENVSGMLSKRHSEAVENIVYKLKNAGKKGYNVNYKLLNASDFGVPQDRKRVFFIGYRKDLNIIFDFDSFIKENEVTAKATLKDTILDLKDNAVSACEFNKSNSNCAIPNHEYMNGGFSTIYMSRNRVRGWDEQLYTIQAGGRHAPMHPAAPKMIKLEKDRMKFAEGSEKSYRRLSIRECARIQTFPDDFIFYYRSLADGYKMVGNAVPVKLSYLLAKAILEDLKKSI
jgi:DNA (cytosine-5)-methyltransferase 1